MNVIVCIKQVPGTTEVKMNKETNTIIREGIKSIINPFDTFAIEEALRIKDKFNSKVTGLSMGIPDTSILLKEAMSLGVDEAYLLSDRAFAGADSLATAYTLSMGIKYINDYDLIICGKQATDGDTAQVGPSLAGKLNIPYITYVSEIQELKDGYIRCKRLIENGYEIIESTLPALITVVEDINVPRLPSIKNLRESFDKKVTMLTANDINADTTLTGLNGSPTQVVKTFIPEYDITSEIIEGNPDEQADKLVDKLLSMGLSVSK
ncbi:MULTISPECIES: electron transfer flavoprotein subunit beta/FixA family protein [Clostridium]|uniref:Electron transfer flavoprotein small subunit n=1 Tax=Clostridium novyi (strain NT) TaxID=386415 RepID=A0PY36_CLONN|nr:MULTISPECIES: electron transfer flavoprotein subunit beta/FixA family protein [Clostridium]ABK61465.1 Electron transfer flavoprotein beta-subunit [Clostridium novyi NT]KEH87254.1 electron transfer flavoprotein subunit beta [Clostridium novyi A str. NCTC 538]KEH90796.1 electron transfer flavoprotein subunit beta [Clostridium novyi A str. BKT29909]KEH92155.1 electron transfer flavoprotein subunit beta [Clostridium botulinum C/D str. It1]